MERSLDLAALCGRCRRRRRPLARTCAQFAPASPPARMPAGMAGRQLYDLAFSQALGAVERGLVPDAVVRAGIRWLLTQRKREVGAAHFKLRAAAASDSKLLVWLGSVCHSIAASSWPGCVGCCHACTAHALISPRLPLSCLHKPLPPAHLHLPISSSPCPACCASLRCLQTTPCGEEYYRRLQAFRDELAGMPVAVQASGGCALARGRAAAHRFIAAPTLHSCLLQAPQDETCGCAVIVQTAAADTEHVLAAPLPPARANPAPAPALLQTAAANEQHYELPTDYFLAALGPHRKYSSCLYDKVRTKRMEAEHTCDLAVCCSVGWARQCALAVCCLLWWQRWPQCPHRKSSPCLYAEAGPEGCCCCCAEAHRLYATNPAALFAPNHLHSHPPSLRPRSPTPGPLCRGPLVRLKCLLTSPCSIRPHLSPAARDDAA